MRMVSAFIIAFALTILAIPFAAAQAPAREMQIGTKTSDIGYAISLAIEIPTDDIQATEGILQDNFALLKEATEAAGFTPVGPARIEVEISFENRPQGDIPAKLQLVVAEQPTDEELDDANLNIVVLEPVKVAYTYHKGSLRDLQISFMRLGQWVLGQGLEPNGFPRIIAYAPGAEPGVAEIQIPVK